MESDKKESHVKEIIAIFVIVTVIAVVAYIIYYRIVRNPLDNTQFIPDTSVNSTSTQSVKNFPTSS